MYKVNTNTDSTKPLTNLHHDVQLVEAGQNAIFYHEVQNLVGVRHILQALQLQDVHVAMMQQGHDAVDGLHVKGVAAKVGWVVGHNGGVVDGGVELQQHLRCHGGCLMKEDELTN